MRLQCTLLEEEIEDLLVSYIHDPITKVSVDPSIHPSQEMRIFQTLKFRETKKRTFPDAFLSLLKYNRRIYQGFAELIVQINVFIFSFRQPAKLIKTEIETPVCMCCLSVQSALLFV